MGADGEPQRTAHLCRWGFGFAAGKKVVISLMKWGGYWNADGSEARASLPWLLENAIHGVFPLGIGHFISEISAFFAIVVKPIPVQPGHCPKGRRPLCCH